MQTTDETRVHCRFVGKGIEKMVADSGDVKIVGGEMGGDNSHIVVSESGVTKIYSDEIVGYAFDLETRAAMVEFFNTLYYT